MAKIKPFKAVIYNQEKIKDLSAVVCPPYDVISPHAQALYHQASPYNFIHILLGKDVAGEDKYQRAAKYFNDWQKNKIFLQEQNPAVYFYQQQFWLRGEKRTRAGFIALMRLPDKEASVFAHEYTRPEPKEDRYKLLAQVKANLSPIFVIFEDKKRVIQRVYEQYITGKAPFIDVTDNDKVNHKLWRLDSPEVISVFEKGMFHENIFIADGHHRYEVACAWRDSMRQQLGAQSNDEASYNYILAYFTNPDPRGLSILPYHRLVNLQSPMPARELISKAAEYFDVEEVKDRNRFFFLMEKAGQAEHIVGLYCDKKYWLLRLKNIKILDKEIPEKPKVYRMLDVSILNYLLLKKILGLDIEDRLQIRFSHDAQELLDSADASEGAKAFFLNPVKIQQVISVALARERMPSKSTYFYPKVLSGLVINKHDEV